MNSEQRATLELLIILAVAIVITANRTSQFWQALFTRQPMQILGPDLSSLKSILTPQVSVNVPNPFSKAGG